MSFTYSGWLRRGRSFRMGIVGAGTMGSLALKMALHLGASEVLVEDVDEVRLAAARADGRNAGGESRERRVGEAVCPVNAERSGPGAGCMRRGKGASAGLRSLQAGGTVVLLGMAKGRSELDFGASIRKEHRVLMSFGYTAADFRRSLDLLVAGEIDLTEWTVEMPLEDGQAAFERMSGTRGDTLKMMLRVR